MNKEELILLYEIKGSIEELRSQRNPEVDMSVIFNCEREQIAHSLQEVNELTKAYVGPLFPGIFKLVGHLEHVYTSYPEGRIARYSVEIGGQTKKELEEALERAGFEISDPARHMMRSEDLMTLIKPEQADLVRLTVGDLFGDQNIHTTDDIYKKADLLGLELCPAEVGPHLRMKLKEQPMGDWFDVAMKPIAAFDGHLNLLRLSVFSLNHHSDGVWLKHYWTLPGTKWFPDSRFIFRLRLRK